MEADMDNFRPAFKYYKSKNPPPDLSRVLHVGPDEPDVEQLPPLPPRDCTQYCNMGLRCPSLWRVFALPHLPGLLVVRGAFTPEGEMFWAAKCLMEYPDPPNINNIENVKTVSHNPKTPNPNSSFDSSRSKSCSCTGALGSSCGMGNVINDSAACANEKCPINNNYGVETNYPLTGDTGTADRNFRDRKNTNSGFNKACRSDTSATNFKSRDEDSSPSKVRRISERSLQVVDEIDVSAGLQNSSSVSTATDVSSGVLGLENQERTTANCLRAKGGWWKTVVERGGPTSPTCRELRWSTLGYHHDWDSKLYSENRRSPFPSCLYRLSSVIASTLAVSLRGDEENRPGVDSFLAARNEENKLLSGTNIRSQKFLAHDGGNNSNESNHKTTENLSCASNDSFFHDGSLANIDAGVTSFTGLSEKPCWKRSTTDDISCHSPIQYAAANTSDCSESGSSALTTDQKNTNTSSEVKQVKFEASLHSQDIGDKRVDLHTTESVKCNSSSIDGTASCNPVRLQHQVTPEQLESFRAEAAIVNYYHPGTSLGPHTDHSEPLHTAPLLSISLGQPCVFLIGGPTKATPPTPLALRSGDVIVMGGAARMCYHAVPCVCSTSRWVELGGHADLRPDRPKCSGVACPQCGEILPSIAGLSTPEVQWDLVRQYLDANRINMNVRQVGDLLLHPDQ